MSGRYSRNKGATFEREVAIELRRLWPKAKRGIGQTRAAHEVADVEGTDGWWVECKCLAKVLPSNIRNAMAQAQKAALAHHTEVLKHEVQVDAQVFLRMPLVIYKSLKQEPMVAAYASDLLPLMGVAYVPQGKDPGFITMPLQTFIAVMGGRV